MSMIDGKMVTGLVLTSSAAAASWVERANEYMTLAVSAAGFVVAILTIWYTVQKISVLREERRQKRRTQKPIQPKDYDPGPGND
jgi:heme exporter protein D